MATFLTGTVSGRLFWDSGLPVIILMSFFSLFTHVIEKSHDPEHDIFLSFLSFSLLETAVMFLVSLPVLVIPSIKARPGKKTLKSQ